MTKRKRGRWLWLLALVFTAAVIVYGFRPRPVSVDVVRPRVGSLAITVDDDGETRIREKYVLFAPVTGNMLRVEVHPGDPVHASETRLARIEPSDPALLDARTENEAEARVRVAVAAASLAQTQVQRAREAVDLAKKNFDRAEKLVKDNAISRAEYDALENTLRLAFADLRSAISAEKVAGYEIDQARAAIDYLQTKFDPEDTNQFEIVSPIDGKVLEVMREDSGVVTAGTPIIKIGDIENLEVVIDVLSTEAVGIKRGDEVVIEHWGGGSPLKARVRLVEPSAFEKVSALGVEEKRVNVIADFTDPWDRRQTLGDGYRIDAKIVTTRTPDETISVPTSALFRDEEGWFVFRVNSDQRAEKIVVQPGLSNGLLTQVVSGVSKSDSIINHPSADLSDGVSVRIEP